MERRIFAALLALTLITMGIVLVWFIIRMLLPVNPVKPYFPEDYDRIPKINWILGQFQPVFLYTFSKNQSQYIKAAYRNTSGRIRLIDLLVGGGKDKLDLAVITISSEPIIKTSKLSDFSKYFKFGDRFNVKYLRRISEEGITEASFFSDEEINNFCSAVPRYCMLGRLMISQQEAYWNFGITGDLQKNLIFAPLYLSREQVN